ncbi:MAG: group II intron reverse transcriptase/maturase [Bacillota bacterium]|nr:group II intron reverse transcriptase/maturase [Bacillota bacterium]
MTTENRRKEEYKAKTEGSRQNLVQPTNSAMVDKAEREKSILSDRQHYTHIPTIEGVVNDYNIQEAVKAVTRNKGAPGIDGVTTEEIKGMIQKQWPKIKEAILDGKYRPSPVKRVEILKPDGSGVRKLGIPTVIDRIIQQAIYQELVFTFEPMFSENSYGFRLGRRAQQAVLKAQTYIQEGCEWVVDIDLEKFFDTVNQDILMSRMARKVKDKKILLLIRKFLQAGVMVDGLVQATEQGTIQGSPLSPLLSNIMLDDFDKELEKRGLRFARYADDCNIYVKSEKAGNRVMQSVVKFLTTKLKLKVNQQKSAVAHPWDRKFLGFTFKKGKEPGRIAIHESRVKRLKDKIRNLTKEMRGKKVTESIRKLIMPITRGWTNYFSIAEEQGIFESLDKWIRRKIRGNLWRQWKNPRTRCKRLIALGLKEHKARKWAGSSKGPWRMARTYCMHKAVSNSVIESMGYVPMKNIVCARS